MPSRPERYVVTALAFAAPAVWTGLGVATAVACVLAAGASYAAGGVAWRPRLSRLKERIAELAARTAQRPAPTRPRPRHVDEPSESAMSGYGW